MFGGRSSLVAVAALGVLAGCRLPGLDGPVSRSLVNSRQLSQQGVAAAERGQWDRADELLADAVRACPSNPDARRSYAEAQWNRGFREQALTQLEAARRLAPDNAPILARLAEMRLAVGQTDVAGRLAQRAVELEPKSSGSWAVRARVLHAAGDPTQSLADYHRALAYGPEDRRIPCEIAGLYLELNQPQRALAAVQGLADRYSVGEEPQEVLHCQGQCYLALGKYGEAVESLTAAAGRDRPGAELLFALAQAQWAAGHSTAAMAATEQALAVDPNHQASRQFLERIQLARQAENVQRR
jgi:tetratricopeptide (TPR) repeat protein